MRWRRILKRCGLGLLGVVVLMAAALWLLDRHFANPGYDGPPSDHFDGQRFHNLETHPAPPADRSRLGWFLSRLTKPAWEPLAITPTTPSPNTDGSLRVTWVGHSTVLIQAGLCNILTDPIWSDRASPVSFTGPQRRAAPGVRFEDLPPIHLILVSHDHYDHCDLDTLQRLARTHHAPIIVGLGVDRLLTANDIPNVTAIDWWQSIEPLAGVRVTGVPAQHFSARFLSDRNRDLWQGYVLETQVGAIYFAGDTGMGGHFAAIASRFPSIRLALIPIGAYQPRWIMAPVHMNPAEAVEAARIIGARTTLAIHWGTFPLADDAPDDPPRDLAAALAAHPLPSPFWVFHHGEQRDVP